MIKNHQVNATTATAPPAGGLMCGAAVAAIGPQLAKWPALPIACFHRRSSEHHPVTTVAVAYEPEAILLHFMVQDRFVVARHTHYQDSVCQDSCVEAFLEPVAGRGYFNFEFNCCGTLLVSYCPRPIREGGHIMLPKELGRLVEIHASLTGPLATERSEAVNWTLTARVPLATMEPFAGKLAPLPGACWRGNFYKCADKSSHPHWASWVPVGEELNFHQPQQFGRICFI